MNMAVLGCSIGEGAIIIVLRYYVSDYSGCNDDKIKE